MARRLIDQDRLREQRRQERLLLVMERRFGRAFASEIKQASMAMLSEYELTGSAPSLPVDHAQRLGAIVTEAVTVAIDAFGERVIDQGKSLKLIQEQKSFAEFFARLAAEYVAAEAIRRRITSISEATRSQIIDMIDRGLDEGRGVGAIAKTIADRIPLMSRARGALIARTETHGAANYGANGAARSTGLDLQKEWVAGFDSRTRFTHAAADGQVVEMDQMFEVGGYKLEYPGDPNGPAHETINCRCVVSHTVKGY